MQENEYTYSVNIQFDIENDKILGKFIPNNTTISILKDFFIDITRDSSNHHARILYGSYGTGKSHFLAILSLLLGKQYVDGVAYDTFYKRIHSYDAYLANDIDEYIHTSRKKPYLVVPITFDFENFERSIYFSLRRVLESKGICVKFKSFYTYALSLLDQWGINEESSSRLQTACEANRTTVDDLKKSLLLFDEGAERKFKSVFSDITYGVDFIYEASNLIDNLDEANKAVSVDYSGIIFIFDEFGRYLDDNMKNIKIKAVQDFAEYCDHSKYDTHLILVSHKEIALYTKNYGKTIANEWKKVEGRFKSISINDRQDQCLSLISNIITKRTDYWSTFKKRYQKELDNLYASAMDFKGFLITAMGSANPFEGAYPLHPITLFALDKLSKRIAQNERTFFTYLVSLDENSLHSFLKSNNDNEFRFVGIDALYDYFEPNIKSLQSDISFDWYCKLHNALSKGKFSYNDNVAEVRILKLLVVIGIIDDGGALSPCKSTILRVIDAPSEQLEDAIDSLQKQKIIKYIGSTDRYEFFDGSIYDIEELINNEVANISDELVCKTLNESFVDFILYPYSYNRYYHINRVFIPIFATVEEASRTGYIRQLPDYYDGVLLMLLANADTVEGNIINICEDIPRSIAIVTYDHERISREVKRYVAILCLESKLDKLKENDPAAENELRYYKSEQSSVILKIIHSWRTGKDEESSIVDLGSILSNDAFSNLDERASRIMTQSFPDALIINNELVNKNNLSGTLSTTRKNVLRAMLNDAQPNDYFGMPYLSPEYIFIRSVLVKNGLVDDGEITYNELNQLPDKRQSAVALRSVFTKYITQFKNKPTTFFQLYNELRLPPLGLREGYLSVLIAHMLLPYRKSLVISSHGVDQEMTPDLIEDLIKRPHDYVITITNWSQSQLDYLNALEEMFEKTINPHAIARNRLKGIYEGMFTQYKTINKFSRTTNDYVSDTSKKYRKIMEQTHTDFSKFFFTDLFSICNDYNTAANTVADVLLELSGATVRLQSDLCHEIFTIFNEDDNFFDKDISQYISILYKNQWQEKNKKSFDYYTNVWLKFASQVTPTQDNETTLLEISKLLTGFEFIYWNDEHKTEFNNKLNNIKKTLSAFIQVGALSENQIKLTITTPEGDGKDVVFDISELSQISKTLKNKIAASIDSFGQSISYEERLHVVLSILDDMVEKK